MRQTSLIVFCLAGLLASPPVQGGGPLIELKTNRGLIWRGRSMAHDESTCWLEQVDGQLQEIDLSDVVDFRKVSDTFQSLSPMELRTPLAQEYGKEFEVQVKGKYVVVAPQKKGNDLADRFDALYRSYWNYFSRRSFGLSAPQHPLVVVVLPDQQAFAKHCSQDDIQPSSTLRGYYHTRSNRIVMYLQEEAPPNGKGLSSFSAASGGDAVHFGFRGSVLEPDATMMVRERPPVVPAIDGGTHSTLIHEGTHQLAFNTGLHSRIGEMPKWVVEGLAMLFEAEMDPNSPAGKRRNRVNGLRLAGFADYRPRRKHTLAEFVADESLFSQSVLDAYAEAWSLSYFLAETRSAAYASYLKRMAQRDPLAEYGAAERLADFQAAFGKDLRWLEVEFVRFMDNLVKESPLP